MAAWGRWRGCWLAEGVRLGVMRVWLIDARLCVSAAAASEASVAPPPPGVAALDDATAAAAVLGMALAGMENEPCSVRFCGVLSADMSGPWRPGVDNGMRDGGIDRGGRQKSFSEGETAPSKAVSLPRRVKGLSKLSLVEVESSKPTTRPRG